MSVNEPGGFSVQWGDKRVGTSGTVGTVIFAVLLLVGSTIAGNIYGAKLIVQALYIQSQEHKALMQHNNEIKCLIALTPEDRTNFRLGKYGKTWAGLCWFINPEDVGGLN